MYINMDKSLIPSTKIELCPMTKDDMIDAIVKYAVQYGLDELDYKDEIDFRIDLNGLKADAESAISELFRDIVTDSMCDVDSENFFVNHTSICGFYEFNGMTVLGVFLGGDWESPVYEVIYLEDNIFKCYTPIYGNTWNLWNNSAFGNDEGLDEAYLQKFAPGLSGQDDIEMNEFAIEEELKTVFQVNPNKSFSLLSFMRTELNKLSQSILQPPSGLISNGSSSNNANSNGNSSNSSSNNSISLMSGILQILQAKQYSVIPTLQQALINKGYKSYDKSKCFLNPNSRPDVENDIYSYIINLNPNDIVEIKKIINYIRRYQIKFENGKR